MRQVKPFTDERLADFCAFCGEPPGTGDHVPPKVFLDKPHPEDYPKVGACNRCNSGASLDEEYVACLIEVAACGSADPAEVRRSKIARTLQVKPELARRLEAGFQKDGSFSASQDDDARIRRVFEKIARGLWAYGNGETAGIGTAVLGWAPIATLTSVQLREFYKLNDIELMPEVGSRMLMTVLTGGDGEIINTWTELQCDRFSYAIEVLAARGRIKMIVGNYVVVQVDLVSDSTDLQRWSHCVFGVEERYPRP
jgi:hypothetical protein